MSNLSKNLTLGSLFDGSGGFPLAGMMAGITPVWASEIEPFPILVTTKRIPQMKHYGDISKMDGGKTEPVDIITFGSPCQDLSLAGKRTGIGGAKSSMFFEAIRVIKEMREATNGKYPRWIVWENVPGALSSAKGADFRTVLDEICKIKNETVHIPMPEKRWPTAGEIVGDNYSLAYRILNAQFFGVPQRRRRIFLVADFGGQTAGKILFESEGVFRNFTQKRGAWKGTAANIEASLAAAGYGFDGYNGKIDTNAATLGENCGMSTGRNGAVVLNDQGGQRIDVTEDMTSTLRAQAHHPPCVMEAAPGTRAAGFCTEHSAKAKGIGYEEETAPTLRQGTVPAAVAIENHPNDSRVKLDESGTIQTLTGRAGTGGGNVPMVMNERQYALTVGEDVANTLTGTDYKGTQCVFECDPKTLKIRSGCDGGGKGALVQENQSATLGCNNDQTVFVPFCKGTRPHSAEEGQEWKEAETANTLNTFDIGENRCNELAVKTYGICSNDSNAMKSDNPNSGIYEADTSRTLDANGGNPGCNQGGIAVVEAYALQGSMIGRKDENGPHGNGVNENISFTLNTVDRHGVCTPYQNITGALCEGDKKWVGNQYVAQDKCVVETVASFYPQMKTESQCYREDGVANTLVNGTNPGFQNGIVEPEYSVRRLTPLECCRLQGFPDYWCDNLETENPTADEILKWSDIFETHRKALGKSTKPKTEKQIIKWLKNPYSDSAMYAMWGNGVCLNVVIMLMLGIQMAADKEKL